MMTSTAHHPHPSVSSSNRRNILSASRPCRRNIPPINAMSSAASPNHLEAAKHTVDNYVHNGMIVGLGSGPVSSLAIQHLGRRIRDGSLQQILGIPTSAASASEAEKAGIPVVDMYKDSLQIDFTFVDADGVEEGTLAAVIGRRKIEGDESFVQEKSVITRAGNLVLMVDEKKYSEQIDGSIPVLVKTGNWMETAEEIDDLFIGDAEVWRRPTYGHADPHGGNFPLVTNEGHHVLDLIFTSPILDLAQVAKNLDEIDGVVEHGVISGIPCTAIIASETGIIIVDNMSKTHS